MDTDNIIISAKSDRKYNIRSYWDVKGYLLTETGYFERQGYIFSHVCELKKPFISDFRIMTYEHYRNQPKSMIKWKRKE